MDISVVIPVFNASETILLCLEALLKQDYLPREVILVDNESTDDTREKINNFINSHKIIPIILLRETKKGPAVARNTGIRVAKGDIIVFTDADCIPREDWISNAKRIFNDNAIDIVGGVAGAYRPETILQKYQAIFWQGSQCNNKRQIKDVSDFFRGYMVATSNAVFRKHVVLEIGGFDEYFIPAGEDNDMWMRALKKGYRVIVWEPALFVSHIHKSSVKIILRQAFQYAIATTKVFQRHFRNKLLIDIPRIGLLEINTKKYAIMIGKNAIEALILILVLAIAPSLLPILFTVYFVYQIISIKLELKHLNINSNFLEIIFITLNLMTAKVVDLFGRVYGSIKYRIICI